MIMSTYAEGFMHGVVEATNSTITVESLYLFGERKARDAFYTFENPSYFPKKRGLNEYDKGWMDGIIATLSNVNNETIVVDVNNPNYMSIQIIQNIVDAAMSREIQSLHSENRKKYKDHINKPYPSKNSVKEDKYKNYITKKDYSKIYPKSLDRPAKPSGSYHYHNPQSPTI